MQKLLQVSVEVNIGSVGRIAEQIGQKAIESGWRSYITYARKHLPSESEVIKIGSIIDVYIHGIKTRITDKHAFYSTNATKELIKKIEIIQPDIIHLHHLHGYYINIEVLFNYLANKDIPIVWTLHDCWLFTGHCTYFDYVGCNKWLTGCFKCPQKKEYPASFVIDRSKKNYLQKKELFTSVKNLTIVPVSYWLGDLVSKSFLKNYPIIVIQNGIDIQLFSPQNEIEDVRSKYKIPERFIILGVASTWERRKGLDEFIKLNSLTFDKYCIVLVGLTKKQINEIPNGIIGIQRTENIKELAKLYSLADVFVNPTLEDNFPTTNLESLACGTPVITYKTGGSIESVNENTGLIVEKEDIQSLHEAIKIIESKGKDYYTAHCRQSALEKYNKQDRYKEYINLYNNLLSNTS